MALDLTIERAQLKARVESECCQRLRRIGDLVGRDRVFVGTVAFGKPDEDYSVLRSMAATLPRNTFQKLGLSVGGLKTAFSSLTSTLTTMRTECAATKTERESATGSAAGSASTPNRPIMTTRSCVVSDPVY